MQPMEPPTPHYVEALSIDVLGHAMSFIGSGRLSLRAVDRRFNEAVFRSLSLIKVTAREGNPVQGVLQVASSNSCRIAVRMLRCRPFSKQ